MAGMHAAEAEVKRYRQQEAWFKARVQECERSAQANPALYRWKVRLFGWIGYGYIFLILLFLLLLVGLIVFAIVDLKEGNTILVRVAFFAVLVAGAIIKSLCVKFKPQPGIRLKRDEAPKLFEEVEGIATRLGAPKPNEIRVDNQLNAAAYQRPRLGILGFYENSLLLGMPLLLSLTPDEARSVIAHEFGHFSGQHGRFGAWAYRVTETWSQLRDNLNASGGRGAWLFAGFVQWFYPRFAALTFVLRRQHEYDADRSAADVAGAAVAARTLMKFPFLDKNLSEAFWEPFYEQVRLVAAPPAHAFAGMPEALKKAPGKAEVEEALKRALSEKTDYNDTHPCLSDRLRSLGELPTGDLEPLVGNLSQPLGLSAAEEFFGSSLEGALGKLEAEHNKKIADRWAAEHQKAQKARQQLASLEGTGELTEKQEAERAILTLGVNGPDAGEPLLRAVVDKYPQNAESRYYLGDLLLDRDDPAGIALVEESARLDQAFGPAARKSLAAYYYRIGQTEKVESLRDQEIMARAQTAAQEQAFRTLTMSDNFSSPQLSAEDIEKIRARMREVKRASVAYVVYRTPLGAPAGKNCMITFPKRKLLEPNDYRQRYAKEVVSKPVGGNLSMVYTPQDEKSWRRRLDAIPGAKIYDAKSG